MIGNIHPHVRSQLNTIQLAGLVNTAAIKKHGLKSVLKPMLDELKALEDEGIILSDLENLPEGTPDVIKGGVTVISADNLGGHDIGMYSKSFNQLRSCRFCLISKDDLRKLIDISDIPRRTVDNYNFQADLAERFPQLALIYGVTGRSALNELTHFHAALQMPPDAMARNKFIAFRSHIVK